MIAGRAKRPSSGENPAAVTAARARATKNDPAPKSLSLSGRERHAPSTLRLTARTAPPTRAHSTSLTLIRPGVGHHDLAAAVSEVTAGGLSESRGGTSPAELACTRRDPRRTHMPLIARGRADDRTS